MAELSFETAPPPPATPTKASIFPLEPGGLEPRVATVYSSTDEQREEFLVGARLLKLVGASRTLKPQQFRTVDVLNAPRRFAGVLEPRRSAKTTSILAWALGRCASRDDYLIAYTTGTTAKKARVRYLAEVAAPLERMYPDKKTRPMKIGRVAGMERLEWPNGSRFDILGPSGDDFRSEAYDVIIIDEAGEADPEMTAEILQAALPTQDTRPGALFVAAGTAGQMRDGNLLWDLLERGRAGDPKVSIIEYSVGRDLVAEDYETWELAAPLVLASHPGVGTLTTLENIHDNYLAMSKDLPRFAREYLGVFGTEGSGVALIDPKRWAEAGVDGELPAPPRRFVIGISASPAQTAGSIVAAWRDTEGRACLLQLDHRGGVDWIVGRAKELAASYRNIPLVYDPKGTVNVAIQTLERMPQKPKLVRQDFDDVATGAAKLVQEINAGRVRHWNQDGLSGAAMIARRRDAGNRWAFGRANFEDDITGVEAAALALRYFDAMPKQQGGKVVVVS